MTVTGMANLAVKVADLDAAIAFYERLPVLRSVTAWNGTTPSAPISTSGP